MLKFKFAKLVRDKIVEQQLASGAKPNCRQLSAEEHATELVNKIVEEAKEIPIGTDKTAAEIADVQQAIDDLMKLLAVSKANVKAEQTKKYQKNGGFEKGLYVEYLEVAETDPWVKYFRDNADRYPEID